MYCVERFDVLVALLVCFVLVCCVLMIELVLICSCVDVLMCGVLMTVLVG